jgi:hypothetical protein
VKQSCGVLLEVDTEYFNSNPTSRGGCKLQKAPDEDLVSAGQENAACFRLPRRYRFLGLPKP